MRPLLILLFLVASAFGDQIRVGTLNAYLCFSPAVTHGGQIAESHKLTADQYKRKIENLSSLISDCQIVGLEEIGGKTEVQDFANALGWSWYFSRGKDTYTGEEVGVVYKLPGWKVSNNGRVSVLDKVISKHLLVTATKGSETIKFLVVHLIRPIAKNAEKHRNQLDAIAAWVKSQERDGVEIVVLGDTNDTTHKPGSTLFGPGSEANELAGWAPTHVDGRAYDRLAEFGAWTWSDVTIARPPYGKKPNDLNRRLWSDHFALKAIIIK